MAHRDAHTEHADDTVMAVACGSARRQGVPGLRTRLRLVLRHMHASVTGCQGAQRRKVVDLVEALLPRAAIRCPPGDLMGTNDMGASVTFVHEVSRIDRTV